MQAKNLIVVVVDRLHAGMIGAYGNSWIRTRQLDRLASESFTFDQAFLESPRLDALYRALWFGRHAATGEVANRSASFPKLLGASGMHTVLLTDEREVAELTSRSDFHDTVLVGGPRAEKTAREVADTQLAKLFAAAQQQLGAARPPFLLWVHARGMAGPWDAPRALRESYADEDDPSPPDFVAPPNYRLGERFDPDELLGVTHAYAGQIALLDLCLGQFLDQLQASELDAATAVVFLAARGFPLGEHGRVGPCDEAFYNELTQLVWMWRLPGGIGAAARTQCIVQPSDLPQTLLAWLDIESPEPANGRNLLGLICEDRQSPRELAVMVSAHQRALRTPAWLLRQPMDSPAELFAKPADRFEVNEVAKLCPEVVAGLQAVLADVEATGNVDRDEPLGEPLITIVD